LGKEEKLMRITIDVDISCGPQEVFPWIARPEKALVWQRGVINGEILRETPEKIGTTFREVMEEDGNRLEMSGVITGYIENELIAFHLESRMHKLDVSYSVAGDKYRSTVTADSTIHWKFPMNMISFVIGRKIKAGILRQTRSEFTELKRLCETERAELENRLPDMGAS